MNTTTSPSDLAPLVSFAVVVAWILMVIVHVLFAVSVYRDAGVLARTGVQPAFVGPGVWALATLSGGVFIAAVYWAMHHSTLKR
jgi:hypothetical protein